MVDANIYDPYIGTLWKPGIWATYITFNYIGSYLCTLLEISIYKHSERTSANICEWSSLRMYLDVR